MIHLGKINIAYEGLTSRLRAKYATNTMRLQWRVFLPLLLAVGVSGCDFFGSEASSIDGWYNQTLNKYKDNNTNRVIVPVKPFSIISFDGERKDPFDARNLIQVEVDAGNERVDPNQPDLTRLRQPLETYAISSLSFVGTILQKPPEPNIALVNAAGSLYQVKTGDYLGQDFGQIQEIRDTEIVLMETVKNARGRWERKERIITLAGLSKENLR